MTTKLKILCLHGYRQNAIRFSSQTGSLRKLLKNEVEFFYLSAPHRIPYTEGGDGDEEEQKGWWFTQPTSFSSKDVSDLDKGFSETITAVENYFKEHGPFHGILGFSQGAALTGLLCALKQKNEIDADFKFVIIVSGFKSKSSKHAKYYDEKLNINSLHVIGETDQIISTDMSTDLANLFVDPVILLHPGGHFVPGKSAYKTQYLDFIKKQQELLKL